MSIRWFLCLAVSLVIHLAWFIRADVLQVLRSEGTRIAVVVAGSEPAATPQEPSRSLPQDQPSHGSPKTEVVGNLPERFRPNVETDGEADDLVAGSAKDAPEDQSRQDDTQVATDPAPDAVPAGEQGQQTIKEYRNQLIGKFQDQWQKVPELSTVVQDVGLLPKIDGHFGIVVIAYSFVDHKPGPPFLTFNGGTGASEKVDRFDFSGFSNRIKDRMLYAQYRSWLDEARRQHNLNSLMKIIGLVPTDTDRYFSAKQLRAVQLAGISLDQARGTNGRYEPDGAGGFHLIIDTVTTKNGQTIPVQDEELRFSAVAKQ